MMLCGVYDVINCSLWANSRCGICRSALHQLKYQRQRQHKQHLQYEHRIGRAEPRFFPPYSVKTNVRYTFKGLRKLKLLLRQRVLLVSLQETNIENLWKST